MFRIDTYYKNTCENTTLNCDGVHPTGVLM